MPIQLKSESDTVVDRESARRQLSELQESGKLTTAVTVGILKPEPGDPPGAVRLVMINDGCTVGQAKKLLNTGIQSINTLAHREAPQLTPEQDGLIAQAWLEYAAATHADSAPPEVYLHMRKTFYAGAAALFTAFAEIPNPAGNPAAAQGHINAITEELERFCREVLADEEVPSNATH